MKARTILIAPILIALLAVGIGACTTPTADRESLPTQSSMEKSIDAAFDDVYTRYRLPGLALGVVRDGKSSTHARPARRSPAQASASTAARCSRSRPTARR